jgi:hypothetical protein
VPLPATTEEKMKRNSNSQGFDSAAYESFDVTDTRYYGVFRKGRGEKEYILIEPIRHKKTCGLSEEMKSVMDKRVGPFFRPAKRRCLDYNINSMLSDLLKIRRQWEETNKPIIDRILSEIFGKNYAPYDDDLAMSGILDPDEAATNATMKTLISHQEAESKRNTIYCSFYAQFFHQMASQIEALFLKTLTMNGYEGDKFNRNVLYAFKSSNQKNVKSLEGFAEYKKMYAIWNFLKHNSLSTFSALKKLSPDTLKESEYIQGEPACFYVDLNDRLIDAILSGVETFIKGYCRLVFKEDEQEALWNSEEYFLGVVREVIEETENPLGIPWWI